MEWTTATVMDILYLNSIIYFIVHEKWLWVESDGLSAKNIFYNVHIAFINTM